MLVSVCVLVPQEVECVPYADFFSLLFSLACLLAIFFNFVKLWMSDWLRIAIKSHD